MVFKAGDFRKLVGLVLFALLAPSTVALASDDLWSLTPEHFRDTATIKDDDLDVVATISTEKGYQEKHGLLGMVWIDDFLRAFVNKNTGDTTIQVYEVIPYDAPGWRYYDSASYVTPNGPQVVDVIDIDRSVDACSGYGNCSFREQVGFVVDETLLRSIAATYSPGARSSWQFKFIAHTGDELRDGLAVAEIAGFLEAVDAYRASHHLMVPAMMTQQTNIPSSYAPTVRPKLGVHFVPLDAHGLEILRVASDHGLMVAKVDSNSPASLAGICPGDVVLSFAGLTMSSITDLQNAVRNVKPQQVITARIWRNGNQLDVKIQF